MLTNAWSAMWRHVMRTLAWAPGSILPNVSSKEELLMK
jgi:hypothetical protein